MKAVIIYDTQFGNTKRVAEAIARILNANLFAVSEVQFDQLQDYELFIFGSPIHAWNMSAGMKELMKNLRGTSFAGKKAVAFDTKINSRFAGSATQKIEKQLRNLGFTLAMPGVSFLVQGREGPLVEGEMAKTDAFKTL